MRVKVGLIGAGGFGNIHLEGYEKNENVDLIAIVARTKDHAEKAAQRFSVEQIYFGNEGWKNMLKLENLNAISICTPNYLHAPIALEALRSGIHVLCEKPICINYEELGELEKVVEETKCVFMTSFQKRFNPLMSILKWIIEDEVLGNIILIKYYFSHYGPYTSWKALSKEKWFFDSKMAGGGVLLDLGVHCIDILRYLIGDYAEINGVNSNTSCIDMKDEDNCNVLLSFQNGILGMISVSWCNYPSEIIEIYGTKGNMRLDLHSKRPVSCQPKSLIKNQLIKKAQYFKKLSNNYQNILIDHFIDAITNNKNEHPNFEDGKKAVEFVLEAYEILRKRE